GHDAVTDQPNLYVFHAGVSTFVATLDPNSDSCDWMSRGCVAYPLLGGLTARVSANGAFIGLDSDKSLTGYDNSGPSCSGSCEEVFLYDTATGTLDCASCGPKSSPSTSSAVLRFPAPASKSEEMRNAYPQRNVSNDGQVFFETLAALAPSDTNGKRDVYEDENGRSFLISSGTSEADSVFLDASVNGGNVFFATAQRLLERDGDEAYDIYDARVDGGF